MSETKFTKGPWVSEVRKIDGNIESVYVTGGFGGFEMTACDNAEANSNLIAAAPDMYEALQDAESMLNASVGEYFYDRKLHDHIELLLAKAGGEK